MLCRPVAPAAAPVIGRLSFDALAYANQVENALARQHNESSLPTVVTAIPGARFSPGGPRCVIGLRVVRISRLPVSARAVRTGVVRVEELIVRGYGRLVRLVRVVFGRRVHVIGC